MAVWSGGELKKVEGHVRSQHQLSGTISGRVNSFHNQALANCPPGFEVLARSEDGGIEAIGHKQLSWEGWMWHPEREKNFGIQDLDRVRRLFALAG